MAFFGLIGNYDKPGPGVSKDEPKKAAPVRFFEILWRKLSKLVQLNLIFMIPFAVVVALMVVIFFLPLPHFAFNTSLFGPLDLYAIYAVPLPLILMAPFSAGMAYVTRNFAREEHAFVWSDFWEAVKNNWKASLLNGIIVYVAYVFLSFSVFFYSNQMQSNWLYMVPFLSLIHICGGFCGAWLRTFIFLRILFCAIRLKFGAKNNIIEQMRRYGDFLIPPVFRDADLNRSAQTGIFRRSARSAGFRLKGI